MKPRNMLFIMSDEHNPRVLGCGGHPMIRTPNLDRLAAHGVRFTDANCNSPICVPSRASFHTGRHVHQIRFWDNAIAYDGSIPTWGHRLRAAGHRVDSIGKLHLKSATIDNGFTQEHMPLHVVEGIGDPLGLLRDPLPVRKAALRLAADAGRATPPTRTTTNALPLPPKPGSKSAQARRPASHGFSSFRSSARTSRSSPATNGTTSIPRTRYPGR